MNSKDLLTKTIEHAFKKVTELGLEFDPSISDLTSQMGDEVSMTANLNASESEVLKAILSLKACDMAVLNKHNIVTSDDNPKISLICFDFLVLCPRSVIIENQNVTSSVLSSGDVRILEDVGIKTNSELVDMTTEEIIKKALDHIYQRSPSVYIPAEGIDLMKKRLELWKLQAQILNILGRQEGTAFQQ